MTYDFKLRTGFFKTQQYNLDIERNQLILTIKQDGKFDKIIIKDRELNTVSIIKRDLRLIELEINTQNGIYIGNFAEGTNIEELICVLAKEFGRKFIIG